MASLLDKIASHHNQTEYKDLMWKGSFDDYLEKVKENPDIVRSAYQRLHDMVLGYGTREYVDNKKKITSYNFFSDEGDGGGDAIFGLDIALMTLVNVI